MPQSVWPITPVEIAHNHINYNWADLNLSAYLPVGATGAIVYIYNTAAGVMPYGLRMNGSTDNRVGDMTGTHHCWGMVGVDANRIIEFNNVDIGATKVGMFLVGYTTTGITFFADGLDITPGAGVWTAIDLSALIPTDAIGVIVEVYGWPATAYGLRMNGSTDNRITNSSNRRSQFTAEIGCDANRIIEGYRNAPDFYLLGYITDGCTFHQNARDVTPAAVLAFELLPLLQPNSVMGFIEVIGGWGPQRFREHPAGWESGFNLNSLHYWVNVACGPYGGIDGVRGNVGESFWLTGYAHLTPPTVQTDPATEIT